MPRSEDGNTITSGEVTAVTGDRNRRKRKLGDSNSCSMESLRELGSTGGPADPVGAGAKPSGLRMGKWTVEEEVYAEYLTSLFMQGVLHDCRVHTTLRAYLAEKLSCKPMRVTKKYATGSYDGKMMYTPSGRILSNQEQLAILREKYIESVSLPRSKRSHKKKTMLVSLDQLVADLKEEDDCTEESSSSSSGQASATSSVSLSKLSFLEDSDCSQRDLISGSIDDNEVCELKEEKEKINKR